MKSTIVFVLLNFLTTAALARPSIEEQAKISLRNLVKNLSPQGTSSGVIVASPSRQNPDYFYHWIRDAALVKYVLVSRYQFPSSPQEKKYMENQLLHGARFAKKLQHTPNPSHGPGEPKFHVDGRAFTGPWGRPQNDGPALRALVFAKFALQLMREGREDLAKSLYWGDTQGIIKFDLEYVAHKWQQPSFDLWEEVFGMHFYTLIVQKRSLEMGAMLAHKLGDPRAAHFYLKQSRLIGQGLNNFYDPQRKFLRVTLNRSGGLDYKHSQIDAAIILGVNHAGYTKGPFSPLDERVLSSATRIRDAFSRLYVMNTNEAAPAIGRYPEDRYNGYRNDSLGNPWFIGTHAFAEYNGRLAKQLSLQPEIRLTPALREYLSRSVPEAPIKSAVISRRTIRRSEALFNQTVQLVRNIGRAYLHKSLKHVSNDGRMDEQMNRDRGFMQGARHLTWSYSSYITAEQALRLGR